MRLTVHLNEYWNGQRKGNGAGLSWIAGCAEAQGKQCIQLAGDMLWFTRFETAFTNEDVTTVFHVVSFKSHCERRSSDLEYQP